MYLPNESPITGNLSGISAGGAYSKQGAYAKKIHLPFVIRRALYESDLKEIRDLRHAGYGRHLPEYSDVFNSVDELDFHNDVTLFIAKDKITGETVGSLRVQTNLTGPVEIENSMPLPPSFFDMHLCEMSRLVVKPGYVPQVRLALVKTAYMFCVGRQIRAIIASARQSMVRYYQSMGYSDVYEDKRMVHLKHVGNIPHRLIFLDIVGAEHDWLSSKRSGYDFIFKQYHPDLNIFDKHGSIQKIFSNSGGISEEEILMNNA